ncbi:ABC transporter substrate-binding protein [Leifsonia shinshuensis]|uniref:ABC transporter substrate-binding protein n=1 Tax=Leifsonia shinshuensis TaxID=150026 RepID=UPI001CA4DE7A|nr:extracellular solute-binding protein [Leifsonia shinshuensis]
MGTFIKGEKMATRRRFAAVAAIGLALTLAACSSTAGSNPTSTSTEKVQLTFWGNTQGQKDQVALWNESHPNTLVTYVQQGGDSDLTQAVQNAAKAGNAPDLFQMPRGTSVSFLVEGVTQDISKWFNNDDKAFDKTAYDFVHIGKVAVGVPYATNPTFNAINAKTFAQFGYSAPKNWDEAIQQAIEMNKKGVKSFNFPGEDPSYLRDWATQAGAQWWSSDGNKWKVGFTSSQSLAAGDLVQKVIDNNLDANYTYIEWDALMQFFSSGQLSQFTTSTWQLPVYEQNFAKSVGDWELASYPTWKDGGKLVSPSYFNAYGVSKATKHPQQAVEFARWLATNPKSVALLADTVKGAATFPVVADSSKYIEGLLPSKLLGDTKKDAPAVIEKAVQTSRSMKDGPDQSAALEELATWWAKAVSKQVTVRQVLEHMQEWTVSDLQSKHISVAK